MKPTGYPRVRYTVCPLEVVTIDCSLCVNSGANSYHGPHTPEVSPRKNDWLEVVSRWITSPPVPLVVNGRTSSVASVVTTPGMLTIVGNTAKLIKNRPVVISELRSV